MTEKTFNLLHPLDWYYPDYFNELPSEEEQYALISKYRELGKNGFVDISDNPKIEEEFKKLNELLEKRDYFENVRMLINQLLTGKEPIEIFSSMFPDNKKQSEIFRSQFTDACDIILNSESVDWGRLQIPWYEFKKDIGENIEFLNYNLKIDWSPNFWTKEAREYFFQFWRDRYAKTILFMSPAKKPSGGSGFFDAEYESSRVTTFKFVYYDNHKVNIDYEKRKDLLIKEQNVSQKADKYRIHLLLEAERLGWKMWRDKNIFLIKEGDPIEYISRMKRKNDQNKIAFKEALAMLIEYDRSVGLPITDPDRDIKGAEPINVAEYKKWLTRQGREIEDGSDDDILLKNLFNKNKNATIKPLKDSFIPIIVEELINEQARKDRNENIERNMSGQIISINGINRNSDEDPEDVKVNIVRTNNFNDNLKNIVEAISKDSIKHDDNIINPKDTNEINKEVKIADKDESFKLNFEDNSFIESQNIRITQEEINEKAISIEIPKTESFATSEDLTKSFSDVISKIEHVSEEKNKIEKQGFLIIEPEHSLKIPTNGFYLNLLDEEDFLDTNEQDSEINIKENMYDKLNENNIMVEEKINESFINNDEVETTNEIILQNSLIDKSDEDNNEDNSSGDKGQIGDIPEWEIEGMQASTEDRIKLKDKKQKFKDRKKRIRERNIKVFDRNRQIEKMRSEWKKFPPINTEGNFIDLAKSKIDSFKSGAKSLWKDRIKFNILGNEKDKIKTIKNIAVKILSIRKDKLNYHEDKMEIIESEIKRVKKRKL